MKTKNTLMLVLFLVMTSAQTQADLIIWNDGHYEFGAGESEGEITIINDATANITGGYIGVFTCEDNSEVQITGGERLHQLVYDSSVVNIYGGIFGTSWEFGDYVTLGAWDSSVITIFNVEGCTFVDGIGTWGGITGTWLNDGGDFYIKLRSHDTLSHITCIPEPLSFFLFGAGVLFLSRKTGIRARVQ